MGSPQRKVLTSLLAGATLLSACSNSSGPEVTEAEIPRAPDDLHASAAALAESHLQAIDPTRWQYNAESNVFWQTGLTYASTPPVPELATLGVFVPGEYMTATPNEDGLTFTAEVNPAGRMGAYTAENAPWVLPIDSPDYNQISPPTEYDPASKTYTDQGFIYVEPGARGLNAGAPTAVADLKAAIRYVRANGDALPGDEQNVYAFGLGSGGAQAVVLGASGNNRLYNPYLKQMGAVEGASDQVKGVAAWSPVTNLGNANAEYEWQFGGARQGMEGLPVALSNELAASFVNHLNGLGLKDSAGNPLTLERSDQGIFQAGSYYQFIKGLIEQSLTTFLSSQTFPYTVPQDGPTSNRIPGSPVAEPQAAEAASSGGGEREAEQWSNREEKADGQEKRKAVPGELNLQGRTFATIEEYVGALNANGEWVYYDPAANRVNITNVMDFIKRLKVPTKPVGAYDGLDAQQPENQLFGFGDGKGVHFDPTMAALLDGTDYQEAFTKDLEKVDSVGSNISTRMDMYNPMYYLNTTYLGYESASVAPRWRLRSNIHQGDTPLTTETNLALALQQYPGVEEVDYANVWGQTQTMAEVNGDPIDNFIKWVHAQETTGE